MRMNQDERRFDFHGLGLAPVEKPTILVDSQKPGSQRAEKETQAEKQDATKEESKKETYIFLFCTK